MSDYQETIIDLLRHGEPEGGRKLRGSQDDPLSEDGWEQMRATIGDNRPWQKIISSPLKRCSEFAQEIVCGSNIPYEEVPGFQEIRFGRWEGLSPEEIMTAFPGELEGYWRDPTTFSPPEGETLDDFIKRINSHWDNLLVDHRGQHLLLVCHGGVIRAIINQILEMPLKALWRIEVPFANISRIRVTHFDDYPTTSNLVFHQSSL